MKKKRKTLLGWIQHLQDHIRYDRRSFLLYSILRSIVILIAIRCFLERNYESFAGCILALVLFLLPAIFEETLQIDIPTAFEMTIYLFIFAAEILGEISHYYTLLPGWDTMLHTINGFLFAAVGISLVYVLDRRSSRIDLDPLFLAIVAFCFSMTIGILWEFFEFSMDHLFLLDMQKDTIVQSIHSVTLDPAQTQKVVHVTEILRTVMETGSGEEVVIEGGYLDIGLLDTMKDLFVNFIGAVVYSVFGYFYIKYKDRQERGLNAGSWMLRPLSEKELEEQERIIEDSKPRFRKRKK